MFDVSVERKKYRVSFEHVRTAPDRRDFTNCYIANGNGSVYRGSAICLPCDNYNKNVGRKLALSKALRNAQFTRTDRRKFWDAYFTKRGKVS